MRGPQRTPPLRVLGRNLAGTVGVPGAPILRTGVAPAGTSQFAFECHYIVQRSVVLCVCLIALSAPALAHHGNVAYDMSKLVTVKGTVTQYDFRNPHVEILIEVKKDDRSVETWRGELNSPNIVARAAGWNGKTLKVGDELVLIGNQAKDGATVLRLEKVLRPDGTELFPKGGNDVSRF